MKPVLSMPVKGLSAKPSQYPDDYRYGSYTNGYLRMGMGYGAMVLLKVSLPISSIFMAIT
jgi:hypothetical protein